MARGYQPESPATRRPEPGRHALAAAEGIGRIAAPAASRGGVCAVAEAPVAQGVGARGIGEGVRAHGPRADRVAEAERGAAGRCGEGESADTARGAAVVDGGVEAVRGGQRRHRLGNGTAGRRARAVIGPGVAPKGEGWGNRPGESSDVAMPRCRWGRSAPRRGSVREGERFGAGAPGRQVSQDRVDGLSVLDAGEDPKPCAAGGAGLDVDAEHASESPCPAARGERGGDGGRCVFAVRRG